MIETAPTSKRVSQSIHATRPPTTPMFLEYDWTSNTYRSHLCGAGTSVAHSFETLAASRHALHLIGLRIGDKTDERTWRIEFMEPVAERADFSRLGGWVK